MDETNREVIWNSLTGQSRFSAILDNSQDIMDVSYIPGEGGTHMLRHTGMCRLNGLVFHQKSLDNGPISVREILRGGIYFTKLRK